MTDDHDRIAPDVLAAYDVPDPSPQAGDRLMAALAAQRIERRTGRRAWWLGGGAAMLAAAAAVLVLVTRTPGSPAAVAHGSSAPAMRTSVQLGSRGVAVVESGARIDWQVAASGEAAIRQDAGNVFYRVEHGGAFVVTTSAADVRVTGTCFRVELAAGDVTVVSVDEGSVDVGNRFGSLRIGAGEHAYATAQAAPSTQAPSVVARAPQPLTLDQIKTRLHDQEAEIAKLEAEIAHLRTGPLAVAPPQPRTRPIDMSPQELAELADRCEFPFDVPPTVGSTMMEGILDGGMRAVQLTDDERKAVRQTIDALQPDYQTRLAGFYRELTGSDSELDPTTFIMEIEQKTPAADISLAYQRMSAERAGRSAGPAGTSVIERYLRFSSAVADQYERAFARDLGADRARAFRRTWGMVDWRPGCPSKAGSR